MFITSVKNIINCKNCSFAVYINLYLLFSFIIVPEKL